MLVKLFLCSVVLAGLFTGWALGALIAWALPSIFGPVPF